MNTGINFGFSGHVHWAQFLRNGAGSVCVGELRSQFLKQPCNNTETFVLDALRIHNLPEENKNRNKHRTNWIS